MLIKLNHPKRFKWDPGNVWLQELQKKKSDPCTRKTFHALKRDEELI